MSMHTIFVLIGQDGLPITVSPHLNAEDSVRYFQGWVGKVYACVISEDAAMQVREKLKNTSLYVSDAKDVGMRRAALSQLRNYSHSMMHCADVT